MDSLPADLHVDLSNFYKQYFSKIFHYEFYTPEGPDKLFGHLLKRSHGFSPWMKDEICEKLQLGIKKWFNEIDESPFMDLDELFGNYVPSILTFPCLSTFHAWWCDKKKCGNF